MKKLRCYCLLSILPFLIIGDAFAQVLKNKTSEEFGIAVFECIKSNNFLELTNYIPQAGQTLTVKVDGVDKSFLVTQQMRNETVARFKYAFQIIQDDIAQELASQNLTLSKLRLETVTTEVNINNNVAAEAGIEVFLQIRLGTIKYSIRVEDNIKTKDGYLLADNLKIASKKTQ